MAEAIIRQHLAGPQQDGGSDVARHQRGSSIGWRRRTNEGGMDGDCWGMDDQTSLSGSSKQPSSLLCDVSVVCVASAGLGDVGVGVSLQSRDTKEDDDG